MRRVIPFLLWMTLGLWAKDCARGPEVPLPTVCATPLPNPRLACVVPKDAAGPVANLNAQHRAFGLFSWQSFLAMNWPAGARRGEPAAEKRIGAPGARVWETWKEVSEVYLPGGRRPAPWDDAAGARAAVKKLFRRSQRVEDRLAASVEPTGADGTLPVTLTDRKGRLVRFEIRMNRSAFEYVVAHRLYDSRVQARAEAVDFPEGAAILKAAWRELEPGEEPRYLARRAQVCDEESGGCVLRTVGLVGFHLMVKTAAAPQWVWSTFEHVDNVAGPQPSFYDPACRECAALENRQTPAGIPNQVTRVQPIPAQDPVCTEPGFVDNVAAVNRAIRAALAAEETPLANYEMIDTQWPFLKGTPSTVFHATPALLANTTMETFIQPTSSCMGCHAMARSLRADKFVAADFTFTLNNALPRLPEPKPFAPANAGSPVHARARAVADRTYELVPAPQVVAKLHCSSCHLAAGTEPKAAWWAGSADRFPTRGKLFHRINQCFRNSMNGEALCAQDAECALHPDMMALVTYIEDLTKKWHELHGQEPAPAGFPSIARRTPDAANGRSVFLQKCAFCHGANGAGRYQSGTYYRPALWGPHSFDADAGMNDPGTFAAFIRANMPLDSGGELTEQEAWDIAGFVTSQCRPKKPGCPK